MADFGDLLRRFRERAGFSQSALAQAANIDKSYISRLESGKREVVSCTLALRLAEILKMSASEVDLWLITAGYISPRMQSMATRGVYRLWEEINTLNEGSDSNGE